MATPVLRDREERHGWWERKEEREGRIGGSTKVRERAEVEERSRRSHLLETKETAEEEEEDGGKR